MDPIRNRVRSALNTLAALRCRDSETIEGIQWKEGDYEFWENARKEGKWQSFGPDETWGGKDRHYWFWAEVITGEAWEGKQVRLTLQTGADDIWNTDNPQIMVYVNGKLKASMDMNHQDIILTDSGVKGETFDILFYAYSNYERKTSFFHLSAASYDRETAALYYDMKVLLEAAELLEEQDMERIHALKVLNGCADLLDLRIPGSEAYRASVGAASRFLRENYYEKQKGSPVTVHSIGHTHIDVAWKWPLKQTRQKAVRSFRTVLNLMERYPEYKFMSSQPQLYEFVKEEAPELYEQVKKRVAEGRWEAEGAMWLEPDCNLASGESLIRHILYGRRYFEQELGAPANEVLWLPDVFGYSAALPQIMRKSGLSYFMTTKLGWNEYNKFPYDTFSWKGIDGSQVLTYLITTRDYIPHWDALRPASNSTTYNGLQNPGQIMGTWQRYQNKQVSRDVLTCYGYGDGGGGPTEEMLEQSRRLEYGAPGCPQVRQTFVKEFFHKLEENMDARYLPVWSGELYLEFHRGTYTSAAGNKRYNRKCEFLMGDAEFYSVLARAAGAEREYPSRELEINWKLLLLNQFHDILPGSSIREVYEDSRQQYEAILSSAGRLIREARQEVLAAKAAEGRGRRQSAGQPENLVIWNSLSFARGGLVELEAGQTPEGVLDLGDIPCQQTAEGRMLYLIPEVPSKGCRILCGGENREAGTEAPEDFCEAYPDVIRGISRDEDKGCLAFETPFYRAELNCLGELVHLYDKREERELIQPGGRGNRLVAYEDRPLEFDAWNIDSTYADKYWLMEPEEECRIIENGPVRGCIQVKVRYMNSVICQRICFYRHTARIDFKTEADWREHQILLKTEFPLDIHCSEADYEIQFGNVKRPVHRNTTWDQARFEVCAHKWADLSEYGYGAALLNDCKYGYSIHDSVMTLSLIKSGIFPDPEADQGSHSFTYALYPHTGDFRRGHVIREAYDLNCPLEAERQRGMKEEAFSFLEITEENILADTIKRAEDGQGIIVRLYEAWGRRTRARLRLPMLEGSRIRAEVCSCMEQPDPEGELKAEGRGWELLLKPYEIQTLRFTAEKQG